jgi:hypothetical protein
MLKAVCAIAACASGGDDPTRPDPEQFVELHGYGGPLALIHAHVLTMDNGPMIERDQIVIIRDGRIVAVGRTEEMAPPADARTVDMAGLYVIPGLADMHVHLRREHVPQYLRNGITTVRDLWGHGEILELRSESRNGGNVPWIVTTGPGIDGSPPVRPTPALLDRPEDAAGLVEALALQGWDALKVYQNLRRDAFLALAQAAAAAETDLVGHVPTDVPLSEALGRMRSIEHLEGYDKALVGQRQRGFRSWTLVEPADMALWARRTADSGTWNVPTLVVIRKVLTNNNSSGGAGRGVSNARTMVGHLHDAGASILSGTDAGVPLVEPGTSLHDELAELIAAGLSPYDALAAATASPARFLGLDGQLGVVKAGARADLVLLRANPLEDLRTARSPVAVVLRGRLLVPALIR